MACDISIVEYKDEYEEKWDRFVSTGSINGTFLQTRRFLNYHPKERFVDNSLLFFNGEEIVAVLPAHKAEERLISHEGSTFGGIIIGRQYCKIVYVDMIMGVLDTYLREKAFKEVIIKQTGSFFCQG